MLKTTIFVAGLSFVVSPASAAVIFADNFNRATSNTVGAPSAFPTKTWTEVNANNNDVSIGHVPGSGATCTSANLPVGCNNSLRITDLDPAGTASQLSLSTTGFQNITLSYQWAVRDDEESEASDLLRVQANFGSGFVTLASHGLGGAENIFHSNTISFSALANNLADFEFRFRVVVNDEEEGAWVDNVVLSGTTLSGSTPSAVSEPASLALLAMGAVAFGVSRRRNKT